MSSARSILIYMFLIPPMSNVSCGYRFLSKTYPPIYTIIVPIISSIRPPYTSRSENLSNYHHCIMRKRRIRPIWTCIVSQTCVAADRMFKISKIFTLRAHFGGPLKYLNNSAFPSLVIRFVLSFGCVSSSSSFYCQH